MINNTSNYKKSQSLPCYHFVGIGGVGMGALASLMLAKGFPVSGSDVKENSMIHDLRTKGARIMIGHHADHVQGADYVIFSSAIRADNPEMLRAKQAQIPVIRRAELLAELMKDYVSITVAGAHGKTTTTSMISYLLIKAGLSPTTAVGGSIRGAAYNARLGDGRYFVAELDESDGSFLYFHPQYAVITNVDKEHMDYYGNWGKMIEAYEQHIRHVDPKGRIVVCADDPYLGALLKKCQTPFVTYGFSTSADFSAVDVHSYGLRGVCERFECLMSGEPLGLFELTVPGRHNVLNALACISMGLSLSIPLNLIREALLHYQGVKRRFQIKGEFAGITIVDDYGHHPTEIAATLKTANHLKKERLVTVFQPHRYTRTQLLMEEFVACLSQSEALILTDIYAASESPIPGVTAQDLCQRLIKAGRKNVSYHPREGLGKAVMEMIQPGDMVLTLGAGDITQVSDEVLHLLNERYNAGDLSVENPIIGALQKF
jgi:UDP-N-acetylmuramate--alanine ligase